MDPFTALKVGKEAADAAMGIVGGVADVLQQLKIVGLNDEQKNALEGHVAERVFKSNEQAIERYKLETEDIQSARKASTMLLKDAPMWIRGAAAFVVPYGGIMAISTFFFNIWAGYFDIERVVLTPQESFTLGGIIAFFFGYRLTQKLKGTAGKF